jgi:hypothetical protein
MYQLASLGKELEVVDVPTCTLKNTEKTNCNIDMNFTPVATSMHEFLQYKFELEIYSETGTFR